MSSTIYFNYAGAQNQFTKKGSKEKRHFQIGVCDIEVLINALLFIGCWHHSPNASRIAEINSFWRCYSGIYLWYVCHAEATVYILIVKRSLFSIKRSWYFHQNGFVYRVKHFYAVGVMLSHAIIFGSEKHRHIARYKYIYTHKIIYSYKPAWNIKFK